MTDRDQVGRIAMRVEGQWWVAYYALPGTMDQAIELGRIKMAFVADHVRKQAFLAIIKSGVADMFQQTLGFEITNWDEHPAPESERSGSA